MTNFLSRLLPLLCLAIFLACPSFAADMRAPVEALEKIGSAMDNADADSFQALVDMDAIMDQAMTVFLEEAGKPENARALPPMLAMMLGQLREPGQAGQALRALLRNEAKSFALNGIRSGAFAGKKLNQAQTSGLLAPLFANASTGRKEILPFGQPKKDGDGWTLQFIVHDHGNDQDYVVVGRFSPVENGARMTGIANLEEIFRQIREEAEAAPF